MRRSGRLIGVICLVGTILERAARLLAFGSRVLVGRSFRGCCHDVLEGATNAKNES